MPAKLEHAILVTTSVAGEQVILSQVVSGSTFKVKFMSLGAAFTTYNATEAYLGFARFQQDVGSGWVTIDRSPAMVNTDLDNNNPLLIRPLGAGQDFLVGQGIRGICNPATATSIRWSCCIWGEN